MVIECKGCLKKFKLNEDLLKPQGSRVRCSKCGKVFLAFPTGNGEPRKLTTETDREGGISNQSESAATGFERRSHPRIPVSIPALCSDLDWEGKPMDLQIGVLKEVSQSGVAIEVFSGPVSEEVSISFIGEDNSDVRIFSRVAHYRIESACKVRVGLSLLGSPNEIQHFISQAMTSHYQSGMDLRQSQERRDGAPSKNM